VPLLLKVARRILIESVVGVVDALLAEATRDVRLSAILGIVAVSNA